MIHVAAILPTAAYWSLPKLIPTEYNAWEVGYQQLKNRPYHMALTHLVQRDPDYRELFQEISEQNRRYVILDNSLMESGHQAMTFEAVLDAAEMISADEVVLPDVWLNGVATVEKARETLRQFGGIAVRRELRIAAVVHGTTKEEWLTCYRALLATTNINVIHIPKVMDKYWPGGRVALLHYLHATQQVSKMHEYHLLGIWSDPIELAACSSLSWIRSCDTALPGHAALQYVEFCSTGLPTTALEKTKRPDNYFDLVFNSKQYDLLRINLATMDQLSRGYYW